MESGAAGVVGPFIWPVWFGMDFQDAAGQDAGGAVQAERVFDDTCEGPLRPAAQTASIPQQETRNEYGFT